EGALEHVDDLLATVLVDSGQLETRIPLDDRHVQIVVETQDLTATGRCLRLPLDVALGEVTHPGGGSGLQRRHRNISFARSRPSGKTLVDCHVPVAAFLIALDDGGRLAPDARCHAMPGLTSQISVSMAVRNVTIVWSARWGGIARTRSMSAA